MVEETEEETGEVEKEQIIEAIGAGVEVTEIEMKGKV